MAAQATANYISLDAVDFDYASIRGVHYNAASLLHHEEFTAIAESPRRAPRQRDSLRRREALLVGKEGSRRRRRWDMAHLFTNPHAVEPNENDYLQPGYKHRDDIYSLLASLSISRDASSDEEAETDISPPFNFSKSNLRSRCRKSHLTEAMVLNYETPILHFIKSDKHVLEFDLAHDSFQRFVLHAIARYYGLVSYSRHSRTSPKRMSYVLHPSVFQDKEQPQTPEISFWEWVS